MCSTDQSKKEIGTIKNVLLIFILFLNASNIVYAEDQSNFLKHLTTISQSVQWLPLHIPSSSAIDPETLSTYQSLSYLQGYAPAPPFKNVVYYNHHLALNNYNLFISAHAPQAAVLNMNGQILHQWHFSCASIPNINKEFCPDYWVKAHVLDHGELIAMVPYLGLIKLDKDSKLIWYAKGIFHHDFDIDSNGDIYAFSMAKSTLNNTPIIMNKVSIYSKSGILIKELSLYDLFKKYPDPSYIKRIENPAKSTEQSYAPYGQGDVFHANSIQIITKEEARHSGIFKEGQLLLSVREMGLIMAVDPSLEKIVWLMDAGIWHKGQHSAKLLNNGNILVFDNFYTNTLSRVIEFNPLSRKVIWDFQNPKDRFFSGLIGECYRLPNNNTLITESTNGHTFEITPDKKIVWDFYNPHRAGKDNELIAVTYQLERLDRNTILKWLKK
jgi:Arylsulfotransferase (ASST)